MRKAFAVASLLGVFAAPADAASGAAVSARVDAPQAAHADGVATASAEMPEWFPTARTMRLTLSSGAPQDSHVQIALGRKGPGGALGLSDTGVILGCDHEGRWFARCGGDRLRQRYATQAAGPAPGGVRSLAVRVRLDEQGAPVSVMSLSADGSAVAFEGLDEAALLKLLDPRNWDTLKLASRGAGASAEIRFVADGTVMILR